MILYNLEIIAYGFNTGGHDFATCTGTNLAIGKARAYIVTRNGQLRQIPQQRLHGRERLCNIATSSGIL